MQTFFLVTGILTICGAIVGVLSWLGFTPTRIYKSLLSAYWKKRFQGTNRRVGLNKLSQMIKSSYEANVESVKIATLIDGKSNAYFGHFRNYDYHFKYIINYIKISGDSLVGAITQEIINDVVTKGKATDVTALVYLQNDLNEGFAQNFGEKLPGNPRTLRLVPLTLAHDMNIKFSPDAHLGYGEKVIVLESLLISPIPFEKLLAWLHSYNVDVSAGVVMWDGGLKYFNPVNHILAASDIFKGVEVDLEAVHEAACTCHSQGLDPAQLPDLKYNRYGYVI